MGSAGLVQAAQQGRHWRVLRGMERALLALLDDWGAVQASKARAASGLAVSRSICTRSKALKDTLQALDYLNSCDTML